MQKSLKLPLLSLLGASAAVTLLSSADVRARVTADSGYSKGQTFSAALRFVRVDNGYEVIETDRETGYVLFKYPTPGTDESSPGSIEVIEVDDSVKVVVQLPKMPEYHERVLTSGLLRKLKSEYGQPPRRSKPDTKPPEEDKPPSEGKPDDPRGGKGSNATAG